MTSKEGIKVKEERLKEKEKEDKRKGRGDIYTSRSNQNNFQIPLHGMNCDWWETDGGFQNFPDDWCASYWSPLFYDALYGRLDPIVNVEPIKSRHSFDPSRTNDDSSIPILDDL